jgi:hypothetical protein
MRKIFAPLLVLVGAMLAYAPVMIANGAYESSMGIVSKILYFHAPSGMVMLLSSLVCGDHFWLRLVAASFSAWSVG